MRKPSPARLVGTATLALVLLMTSGAMAWATVYDFGQRLYVPEGVTVAGTDLSGMDRAQAADAIREAVEAPLMAPVRVVAGTTNTSFDPQGAVSVDVDAMLEEAFSPSRQAAFVQRLKRAATGEPYGYEVEPRYSVDASAVADWVATTAARIDAKAIDATLTVQNSAVRITSEKAGRRMDRAQAAAAIQAAFEGEEALSADRSVTLPVASLKPKVKASSFGQTIVVDLSQRKIRLFEGAKVDKIYPCAIGTPSHPTPTGHFEVVLKRYLPTWVNPGSAWAVDMPKTIPPGPGNPLGTRAINLSASGIRFHGTENIGSVGTAASHGCMRMYRRDIEDLYDRVKVGTQVYIVP